MTKVLIIDDEPLARQRIKNLLKKYPDIHILGEAGDASTAIVAINEKQPDLIFLDIQMKSKTGFDVLDKIDKIPMVIFVTAYDKYALKAFDYFAMDYLLKPFKDDRFHLAVSRAISVFKQQELDSFRHKMNHVMGLLKDPEIDWKEFLGSEQAAPTLPIRMGDKIYFLKKSEIEYIQASGYYAEIKANDKQHILRDSLTNLITRLDPTKFIRIHRSNIINKDFIKELISIGYGDYELRMSDDVRLRVSKSYKDDLVKFLNL